MCVRFVVKTVGEQGFCGKNCEITRSRKTLFIKADTVKLYFSSQIKMLKHNKCIVHLASPPAAYNPTDSPAHHEAIIHPISCV